MKHLLLPILVLVLSARVAPAEDPIKLLQKQCRNKKGNACYELGWAYERGDDVQQSKENAFLSFYKACQWNDGAGCTDAGFDAFAGRGTVQDTATGVKLFWRGCQLDNLMGCRNVALVYHSGIPGVPKSAPQALTYFAKACSLGDGPSCGMLGVMYRDGHGTAASLVMASQALTRGCDSLDARSCSRMGELYEKGLLTVSVPTE